MCAWTICHTFRIYFTYDSPRKSVAISSGADQLSPPWVARPTPLDSEGRVKNIFILFNGENNTMAIQKLISRKIYCDHCGAKHRAKSGVIDEELWRKWRIFARFNDKQGWLQGSFHWKGQKISAALRICWNYCEFVQRLQCLKNFQ